MVFGLFAICGYQFSPRIADISDARLWRTNTAADYGPLQAVSNHTIRLDRIRAHWDDMLRVAGSLTLGKVRGHDLSWPPTASRSPTNCSPGSPHSSTTTSTSSAAMPSPARRCRACEGCATRTRMTRRTTPRTDSRRPARSKAVRSRSHHLRLRAGTLDDGRSGVRSRPGRALRLWIHSCSGAESSESRVDK
ncbi:Tn3 family transposase [Streptomyces turgidiscabies]|uniref:Tn3 family transposase n=1 Tax=Streptomyces turgidiscabies TaxID=85558 RepID=UPI00358F2825